MIISVVLPTLNRSHLLDKALKSISIQTLPPDAFEVIVVDNGSTDNTRFVCQEYDDKFKLKYCYDNRPGLHVGRHIGLENASGEVLVYGDDDIRAFPTWLEGIAESFQDPNVGLVGGKCIPEFESEPPVWFKGLWRDTSWGKVIGQYSLLDFGDAVKQISPYYVWGCNFSIKKNLLLECGGFHPDGMPKNLLKFRGDGETAVSAAIDSQERYKVIYNPKASVYHFVSSNRMTIKYLHDRSFAQGISDSYSAIRRGGGVVTHGNIKKISKVIIGKCRSGLKYSFSSKSITDELAKAIYSGYSKGYLYHQWEIARDKKLLDWVLRDNYQGPNNNLPLHLLPS